MARSIALLCLVGFAACDGGTPPARELPAPECVCDADSFCCLGQCLPLGSVCGVARDGGADDGSWLPDPDPDAGPPDGGSGADASFSGCEPRATPGGSLTPVSYACVDANTVHSCASSQQVDCSSSWPDCHDWPDSTNGQWVASCMRSGTSPCDPAVDSARCEGAFIYNCNVNIQYPTSGPPGVASRTDCRPVFGLDGHCVQVGDALKCDSPSVEHCDPRTFRRVCSADGTGRVVCSELHEIVTTEPCEISERCLDNASTRSTSLGVACVGEGATPSATPATTEMVFLACAGTNSVLVEQYGVEWTTHCPEQFSIGPDGTTHAEFMQCYDATAPVRCESPGTVHCDPATYQYQCTSGGAGMIYCSEGGTVFTQACAVGQTPGKCDPSTGHCVGGFPCNSGTAEQCAISNTYRLTCGAAGLTYPEPCPNCRPDPNNDRRVLCGP